MAHSYTWFGRTKRFLLRDLPNFFRNVYKFRKALWNHHWWDYRGTLQFIEIGVDDIAKGTEAKGIEIEESKRKKVAKMKRVVEILINIREDSYFDMVEKEMGKFKRSGFEFVECEDLPDYYQLVSADTEEQKSFNKQYYERVMDLEQSEWAELWDILKGPDYTKVRVMKSWVEQHYDGSGLRAWWD